MEADTKEAKGKVRVRCDACAGMYPMEDVHQFEDDDCVVQQLCDTCLRDIERRCGHF